MQQKISPDLFIEISSDPWSRWVGSPMGSYLLRWEQAQLDAAVSDVFGFHAIQLGFAELSGLRNNRMADRILILRPGDSSPSDVTMTESFGSRMLLELFEDLPFADNSVDLLVLPHVLERAGDPHQVLREVARVLRPEGRAIITGFNPVSLWGARDIFLRPFGRPLIPVEHKSISLPRLRDWLGLLSFDLDQTRYGGYAPPFRKQKALDRCAFMESIGDRFWPICGSVYLLCAVKRVRAMRLLGPAWKNEAHRRNAAVVASPRFEGGGASTPPTQCEKPEKT